MNTRNLLLQLETWAQSELAAKEELMRRLDQLEACITEARDADLRTTALGTEDLVRAGTLRMQTLDALRTSFGTLFGVNGATLTLASIAERVRDKGEDPSRLLRMRATLRENTAAVLQRGRRIAMLARYHTGLLDELFQMLVAQAGGESDVARGALVDARG